MEINLTINNCRQCHHVDHSGSFTVRGARTICGRSEACKARKSKKDFENEYPEYFKRGDIDKHWRHHWYHRIVPENKVPDWCPLKHGARY